ncbi:hypothetical protein TKK_0006490 [Trichogramma kaykai]|uniref:Tyrosinase copper-binding domain-containing protein n=1 Tax=Trichogramma kaykai TaxID=54128 RepID=A0ABD2XD67_9HYME
MANKNLLLLFNRPCEPLYVPKGEKSVCFQVPDSYLPDKYRDKSKIIRQRFNSEAESFVTLKPIDPPDLAPFLKIKRYEAFSLQITSHRQAAMGLVELFMNLKDQDELLAVAAYCRDRLNTRLFVYALSVVILHRTDTKGLQIPNYHEMFPEGYIDSKALHQTREYSSLLSASERQPIDIPLEWTATNEDPEHRVAYWREDIGVNNCHWHWHLVNPFSGPERIVRKDRRGELFFYFHHQIMARYHTERLCAGLPKVVPLDDLDAPIPEAYFPKLEMTMAGRGYPARTVNSKLQDVDRPNENYKISLADMKRYIQRTWDVIYNFKALKRDGTYLQLDESNAVEVLGNLFESNLMSVNKDYYGDVHNSLHNLVSLLHDPDNRYLENFSPIGDSTTAMRDPVFYRIHAFVDDIVNAMQSKLPPYTWKQLSFAGVRVSGVRIETPGENPNTLNTHWTRSEIDLSSGMDFAPREPVLVRVQHLNNAPFNYRIDALNYLYHDALVNVRIFMAPKLDEDGHPLPFEKQRRLMFEMDKFLVKLQRGHNVIARASTASSVTIPFEQTFRDLTKKPASSDLDASLTYNLCGCGWPQHLLVPKGTEQGFPMDLFVMLTDYYVDKVDDPNATLTESSCTSAATLCGLQNRKYPDSRPMGFPFDRPSPTNVARIDQFLTPNMMLQPITVRFSDTVKARGT